MLNSKFKKYVESRWGLDNWIYKSTEEYEDTVNLAAELAEEMGILYFDQYSQIHEDWSKYTWEEFTKILFEKIDKIYA